MIYRNTFLILSFLISLLVLSACSRTDQLDEDIALIEKYIADNNIEDVESTSSGLHYRVINEGSGQRAGGTSTIRIDYEGQLLNGTVFDSGEDVTFPLSNLILAWRQGIPLIEEGGRIILFCPSVLAYGDRQVGNIPPNSVLIFDITLHEVL